jgi:hypothetical protein
MKIERRKHKKIAIGDFVEVHSHEYIKEIFNYSKLNGCNISPYDEFMYGKKYQVISIKEIPFIDNFEKVFPFSKLMYMLQSDNHGYFFYEFEIINCE